jgi:acetyl esterase/lipase
MSIVEALKGIAADVSQMPTPVEKMRGIARYARVLGSEVAGIVSMAPYACSSWWLYNRAKGGHVKGVEVSANYRYGNRSRNVMDVYAPTTMKSEPKEVLLFVHGGVWASGAKWHYAPLATRLAQEGIMTCIMEYSLYPSCEVNTMVEEVSTALDWVMDAPALHGNNSKVVLAGHSAGAHLCALALIERSKHKDKTMPSCFIGMAGVYHIARHYEYEQKRNVHHLSTMKRAIGGTEKFNIHSPTLLLQNSTSWNLSDARCESLLGEDSTHQAADVTQGKYHGDAIPRQKHILEHMDQEWNNNILNSSNSESESLLSLDTSEILRLPEIYVMASCNDHTVPWIQSSDFHHTLRARGMRKSHLLLYKDLGHGDFVVDWRPKTSSPKTWDLDGFAHDLLSIIER